MMWLGMWRPKVIGIQHHVHLPLYKTALRFLILYILGMAAVNLWRGVWYLTDAYLLPDKLTPNEWGEWTLTSFWVSSVVGSSFCFVCFAGASILAPPGIFLLDGPGVNPPPIAITLLPSYYSLTTPAGETPPPASAWMIVFDCVLSFLCIPIMVVWFWRGSWLVMDYYLWGFSPEPKDVQLSIAWSTIIGLGLMFLTSETLFAHVKINNAFLRSLLGRLRTYVLAWGVVNFWRAVWYIWDEFLGGTTQWSAWISHAVSIILLLASGCMACILAPASTLGLDFVPHPEAAEEPLFANLPVPVDDLFVFAIGRQPFSLEEEKLPPEVFESQKNFVESSLMTSGELELMAVGESGARMAAEPEKTAATSEPQLVWRSGSTGRRGAYSSVRHSEEGRPRSYMDMQRPDLDLRVSHTSTVNSMRSTGKSVRSTSDFFRSR
jgi:hypothetical protein